MTRPRYSISRFVVGGGTIAVVAHPVADGTLNPNVEITTTLPIHSSGLSESVDALRRRLEEMLPEVLEGGDE